MRSTTLDTWLPDQIAFMQCISQLSLSLSFLLLCALFPTCMCSQISEIWALKLLTFLLQNRKHFVECACEFSLVKLRSTDLTGNLTSLFMSYNKITLYKLLDRVNYYSDPHSCPNFWFSPLYGDSLSVSSLIDRSSSI